MYGFQPFSIQDRSFFVEGLAGGSYFSSGERQCLVKSIMDRALTVWTDRMRRAHAFDAISSRPADKVLGWPRQLLEEHDDRVMLEDFMG